MNQKKKIRLVLLAAFFVIMLGGYIGIRIYNHKAEQEAETAEEEKELVLSIDSEDVTEIGITSGEESINLKKDGDNWICVDDETFGIDEDQVSEFLANACEIQAEMKIEDVTDFEQYGLADAGYRISLQWDNNLYVIHFGDQNSLADNCYYVRLNEDATVYAVESSVYSSLHKTLSDFEGAVETAEEEETDS